MKKISIKDAVTHFGRTGDGYGGQAALARALGVRPQNITRWSGPFVPQKYADKLLAEHADFHLLAKEIPVSPPARRVRAHRKLPA